MMMKDRSNLYKVSKVLYSVFFIKVALVSNYEEVMDQQQEQFEVSEAQSILVEHYIK